MNRINSGLSAFSLATALLSIGSFAGPPGPGTSKAEPSMQQRTAFHVIGLMKTKSGAI